jgi:hypothetical protein
MSFDSPVRVALDSLLYPRRTFSIEKKTAFKYLRDISGADMGDDIRAWIEWAKKEGFVEKAYPGGEDLDQILSHNEEK